MRRVQALAAGPSRADLRPGDHTRRRPAPKSPSVRDGRGRPVATAAPSRVLLVGAWNATLRSTSGAR